MNRSESKYFNTAERMDRALLELLEEKELAYITVKELCKRAGVNRSTFYLHYETMGDLLAEAVEYMERRFLSYFEPEAQPVVSRLHDCPPEELYLITPRQLTPFLNFVREHRRVYRAALKNPTALGLERTYERMFRHVFAPILERYGVAEADRAYVMAFYIRGLVAMVAAWLERDCRDSVEHMTELIMLCVGPPDKVRGQK